MDVELGSNNQFSFHGSSKLIDCIHVYPLSIHKLYNCVSIMYGWLPSNASRDHYQGVKTVILTSGTNNCLGNRQYHIKLHVYKSTECIFIIT